MNSLLLCRFWRTSPDNSGFADLLVLAAVGSVAGFVAYLDGAALLPVAAGGHTHGRRIHPVCSLVVARRDCGNNWSSGKPLPVRFAAYLANSAQANLSATKNRGELLQQASE